MSMVNGPSYLTFSSVDLDQTPQVVKGANGQVHGWFLSNTTSSKVYVKLYETSPSVGTTVPLVTLQVPANGSANQEFLRGISFSTGIWAACTASSAVSDTTDPGAGACIANVFYL